MTPPPPLCFAATLCFGSVMRLAGTRAAASAPSASLTGCRRSGGGVQMLPLDDSINIDDGGKEPLNERGKTPNRHPGDQV